MTPALLLIAIHVGAFWTVALLFEWMEHQPALQRFRVPATGISPSFWQQVPACLKNQLFLLAFMTVVFPVPMETPLEWSRWLAVDVAGTHFLHEAVLMVCHWALHRPRFYLYHKMHHSSFSQHALSALYMTQVDFMGEAILPFSAYPVLKWYVFGLDTPLALMAFLVVVGVAFIQYEHSGFNFGGLGNPHYEHHKPGQGDVNLGQLASFLGVGRIAR